MTWKKAVLLLLALGMLPAAHLHPYCQVTVAGRRLDGLYSREQLKECCAAAAETAEELLPGQVSAPEFQRRLHLSLFAPDGDPTALTDALVLAYPGVTLSNGVFVNGVNLGTVADSKLLYEELRRFIENQMPNAAVFGNISGQLQIRPVYSRIGHETPYEDMVLLISGMAPVVYLDSEGRLA